MFSEH